MQKRIIAKSLFLLIGPLAPKVSRSPSSRQAQNRIEALAQSSLPYIFFLGMQIAILQLAGCGVDEPAIARIGDAVITASDFEGFVGRLPPELRSEKQGREADLDYLNSMVDQEILRQEARARGIDTSAVITAKLQELVQQQLAGRYRAQVIAPRVQIGPEDIKRAFVDMGFDRERLFSRISVRTPEEVEEVVRQLRQGQPFEEMARRFAANDLFAREDGEVDWIGRTQAERFGIPQRIFFSLPAGQVAEPLRMPAGFWQIYRFVEDREAKIEPYQREIGEMLQKERQWAKTREEFEVLSHKYALRLHPEAIHLLMQRGAQQPIHTIELAPDEADRPLYSIEGGRIALSDFLTRLRSIGFREAPQDSAQIVELAESVVLPTYLFARAGREKGWEEEPGFGEWRARKRKELILTTLMKAETTDRIVVTEAELRQFYEADPARYRQPEQVIVQEVWAHTEEEARELRAQIEKGTDIPELVRRPDVHSHGYRHRGGEMRLRHLFKAPYPELVDAAFEAQEGDLIGPIALKKMESYAVFRVLKREGSRIRTFEEAQQQVRALVRTNRESELTTAFIKRLREKYEDRIELFADRLGQESVR